MKRSFLVIAALSVVGLILGGFSLIGHSGTAKAAGPYTVNVVSIPAGPASGVSATVSFQDGAGLNAQATNVTMPTALQFNFPAIFFFTGQDCLLQDAVAIAIWQPGAATQNAFLMPAVYQYLTENPVLFGLNDNGNGTFNFADLPVDPGYNTTAFMTSDPASPYTDGADSILSVGISTLPGYNPALGAVPYLPIARIQHLACGNVNGDPVDSAALWSHLSSTWRLPDPACDINEDLTCLGDDVHYALDMDVTDGTSACNPITSPGTHMVNDDYDVAVCLVNAGVWDQIQYGPPSALGFTIAFNATMNTCQAAGSGNKAYNPDADCNGVDCVSFSSPDLGTGWNCSGTGNGPTCAAGAATLGCYTQTPPGTLPTGDNGFASAIALIHLHAASVGTDTLTFTAANEADPGHSGIVQCPPASGDVNRCYSGIDVKAVPADTATATATNTNTPTATATLVPPTATFTDTPTATNTPTGNSMDKVCPDGTNNCILWVQKNNCQPTLGKGCLEIDVWIRGIADVCNPNDIGCTVPEGLGAWEHEMFWDKQFVSVTTVPDNTWLTSGGRVIPPGGCFVQILNEQSLIEGCVTKDTNPPTGAVGPEGSGIVERIYITPNLANLIYAYAMRPTKDNGITTTLADKDCEVTDTQGEMIPGSLPGQLTAHCNSVFFTIRMLEGDLNEDCQVSVADDQAEAFRYKAEVGMSLYNQWYDLEPKWSGGDGDVDIKDLQFVFGRNYSTCESPIPNDQDVPVPPVDP